MCECRSPPGEGETEIKARDSAASLATASAELCRFEPHPIFQPVTQPGMNARSRGALAPGGIRKASPSIMMRAQGMPGEGLTHGPPAAKNAGGRYHRQSRSTGIPCAAVLTLIRDLLGAPGLLATVATTRVKRAIAGHQHRGVRTTRLHVRKCIIRPRRKAR